MPEVSWPAAAFLGFILAQRLGELALARRNTRRLMARGAREVGAGHYPLIVALHAGWIATLVILGANNALSLPWLAAYAVLQVLRVWILVALGPRWTTRIIVLDGAPLVRRGPFKLLRHPNYTLVAAEIFVAPMVLGLPWVALAFTGLNAVVLAIRISVEDRALRP